MPRSSYKKTKKGIIILYKNIIILIRVDMEAIDQIIGLKGQSCSETISLVVTWLSRPSSPWYFYTYGPPQPTTSQQKMEHLSKLIPKPAMSTSNEKYQLLTRMLQAPRMIGGLMLIPIFATHFVQARLPCGLNSYIIFYSFKYGPSPCDLLGEIEEVWFGGYGSVPFGPFAWAQPMHATKWVRDIGSTSGS